MAEILYAIPHVLATPIEKNFTPEVTVNFAKNNWSVAFGCVVGYLLFITVGAKIMEKVEKPFNLRFQLACWNAFLCTFSFIGMVKTVPFLLALVMTENFEATITSDPLETWGKGPTGFWVMLFIYSKIPELIDTVFIVLRKRPLIFLHWYHHVTVLLFCWSAFSTMSGSGLYFVAMNYTVHALMYGYYCLQALGMCPKSFPAILITLSQIGQMFIGTGVCVSAWYYTLTGKPNNDISNLTAGALMYGSYLYLFVDFAVRRYAGKGKGAKGKASTGKTVTFEAKKLE
jgi:elongation of very long chain fatty acids protein 6